MALTEQRIVKQVALLPESNTIQVQWADQIFRNGDLVAESFHRKAYSQEQKEQFLAEVENAESYLSAIGW